MLHSKLSNTKLLWKLYSNDDEALLFFLTLKVILTKITISWNCVNKIASKFVHTPTFSIKTKYIKVFQHQFCPEPNSLIKAIAIKIQSLTADAIKSGSSAHEISLRSLFCRYDASVRSILWTWLRHNFCVQQACYFHFSGTMMKILSSDDADETWIGFNSPREVSVNHSG